MFPILGIIRVPGSWARRGRRPVGLGLAVGVLLMEAALRLVPGLMPRPDPYMSLYPQSFEGTIRHDDASFTFQTDSRGFRNAGPWPARADILDRYLPGAVVDGRPDRLATWVHLTEEGNQRLAEALSTAIRPVLADALAPGTRRALPAAAAIVVPWP